MAPRLGLLAVLTVAFVGPAVCEEPRTDRHGDPLPDGALLRLGTVRMRHAHLTQDVVFTPDGKTVISAGLPDVIRLWDAATGAPRGVLTGGPPGGVYSLALSPDGKTLAACNADTSITLWDLAGRRVLHTLKGHTGLARRMFFTPDGKTLISPGGDGGPGDGHVIFWDVATGTQSARFKADEKWVVGAALSADGETLFTSGEDWAVHIWDVAGRKELHQIPRPAGHHLSPIALSPDGKTLAGTGKEGIRLWDAKKGREIRQLGTPHSGARTLVFSPDGKKLFADELGTIVCLDVATGESRRLEGHSDSINNLTFSPDGKTLASVSQDQSVRLWDAATGKERLRSDAPTGAALAAYFTPDRKHIVTANQDQWIRVWDADSGRLVRRFGRDDYRTSGSRIMCVALSPDGKTAAASHDGDCAIILWDVSEGKELHRFGRGSKHIPMSLAFTPDGRTLVTGGYGKEACLWDVATGKEVRSVDAGNDAVFSVSVSGDGSLLALAGFDLVHRVFAVADGRPAALIEKPGGRGPSTLSPDGRVLAVLADGNLSLWETSSGKSFFAPGAQASWDVPARAFSPDGRLLAWGDRLNVVHVIDARTGEDRARLEGHTGPVTCVSFSADGRRLLSAGHESTVLVWDATRLKPTRDRPRELTARDLDALWEHLRGEDAGAARSAVEDLAAASKSSVPFLRERVRPVPLADAARINRLIRDLDSDDFDAREKASAELARIGDSAGPALREAVKNPPSAEARQRMEQLLERLPSWRYPLTGEPLRLVRAVEVLERAGAREELAALARGAAGARLTQEAAAALKRLEKRGDR
jgi:WD40 repeat protein